MESGKGMAEYMVKIEELKKKGISQREILWGGPPTDIEKGRLGISD